MVAMVIGNLIRNALQNSGGRGALCRLTRDAFSVSNQGHIPDEQLSQLFTRGYTTRTGGHGMGLYLARRICDRYGWQISLRNDGSDVTAQVLFQS
jgi:signal transduction histidine kinase